MTINDGLIVIDDNKRPICGSMDNYDRANELRSMNQKLKVWYGEKEELHQRFTMQQGRLQRQEAELHSKDLALKNKEAPIS